jgi:hypothetical protein
MAKRAKRGDDPYADLKERVIRLESDVQWIKKIVWRDHYLTISTLIGIILTILAVLLK